MRIHFIQHEVFEAPGAYLAWAEKQQHEVTFSRSTNRTFCQTKLIPSMY